MNRQIAKELIKARKAVKRKYQALKSDVASMQIRQEKGLKPIIEPLQELIKTIKSELPTKQEPKSSSLFSTPQKEKYDEYSFLNEVPKRRQTNIYQKYLPSKIPSFLESEDVFETIAHEDVFSEPTTEDITQNILEMTQTPAYNEYLESFHPLVRSFVDASIKSDRDLDHTHGLKHDASTEKWKIGDTLVDFEQENFKVQNITYKGTPGLYELLFFQEPVGYTSKDLEDYMDILKRTNAYRRNYDPNEQVQGTTDSKYLTIIKPYLIRKKIIKPSKSSYSSASSLDRPKPPTTRKRTLRSQEGAGMLDLSNKKIDFVYYDNINEIVERLKLLVSSQMAGHTGHQNEIESILEELREAKIIE